MKLSNHVTLILLEELTLRRTNRGTAGSAEVSGQAHRARLGHLLLTGLGLQWITFVIDQIYSTGIMYLSLRSKLAHYENIRPF